ncbi:MAG: prepilin peptidase [Gemmatimonadota bacterium]
MSEPTIAVGRTGDPLLAGALIVVCAFAVWFDLKEGRIPNVLTLAGLVAALLLRLPGGGHAVATGLGGAGIALGVGLPFFLVGGLGGGDVKLLAAVGAFLGTSRILDGLLAAALVGAGLGVAVMVARGATRQTMANLHTILRTFGRGTFTGWRSGAENRAAVTLSTPGAIAVPYGIAIAAGALVGWFA